nr:CPBP family intramembrane glutamic endopeptidase [Clostridium estertheticum]
MVWISFGINDVTSILYIFLNLPLFLIGGGFEELGWRGYLQPQLEKVVNYFPSVLIVGIIWSMWHLPLWLIKGTPQSAIPFGLYAFLGVVLSFTFTTIYKYTKNLLLCVLSHAWFDGCIGLAVYIGSEGYLQLNLNWKVFLVFILELIVSVILGIAYNRKKSIKINNKIRLS